jgi:enediyne biosynthesis protein E4
MPTTAPPAFRLRLISRLVLPYAVWPALVALCLVQGIGQDTSRAQQGGAATGTAHAPVKDAQSRPITAGGFVDNAPVIFIDITHTAGLDKFHHVSGIPEKSTILETPGSGVALLDYDNDGWLDIYVSNFGKNRLYHNNHDGTFTDVAEKAGVTLGGWSTGATWGDYDHDGRLDLFVPGYVKFDPENPPIAGKGGLPPGFCQFRGVNVMCGPRGLPGESDHLFHNNGDGTFSDVSTKAGVSDRRGYYGLSSVFVDVDDDGWLDLIVANDSVPKYLYRNKHDGTFEDSSYLSGFALNDEGREQAAMGIAVGDYNHDGKVDFAITNFSDDYNTLYPNEGDASFSDVSYAAGIANPTIPFLGWGTGFLDYDNDGWLDLFFANGHVYPGVDQQDWGTTWAQRPLLFRNVNGSKFEEVPPATGSGLATRGAAFGDLFTPELNRNDRKERGSGEVLLGSISLPSLA